MRKNLTDEALLAIAGGRVWSGQQALGLGLVDKLGGLDDALAALKQKVGEEDLPVTSFPDTDANPLKMLESLFEGVSIADRSKLELLKLAGFDLDQSVAMTLDALRNPATAAGVDAHALRDVDPVGVRRPGPMRFVKMHGLGNDFVVVDALAERVDGEPAALARRICDRHFGIGADGLILILPPERGIRSRRPDADLERRRGRARDVRQRHPLRLQARARSTGSRARTPCASRRAAARSCSRTRSTATGDVDFVTVSMGEPILDAARIPVRLGDLARVVDAPVAPAAWASVLGTEPWGEACGLDPRVTCVSMGNPHAVFWCRDVALVPVQAVGPILEGHPMFPNRTNVHFAQVVGPGEVRIRTWERGAGMTLACGTGASAVCVAGALTGRTPRRVLAHLPGGDLDVEWSARGQPGADERSRGRRLLGRVAGLSAVAERAGAGVASSWPPPATSSSCR